MHNTSPELCKYVAGLPKGGNIEVASRLTTKDNPAGYYGHNMPRADIGDVDWDARTAIDAAGGHHMGCAEIGRISDAFEAGDSMKGAVMETVNVAPGSPKHLTPRKPCSNECAPLLPQLGISVMHN
ncbi:hypothetical protein [Kitasatospora sp. NPDC091276]|uniref:hypothetical protein n=1 Tax=Kitasatospora sp. NPDC091276 TaxID=3155300 RepID=UPI003445FDD8